MYSYTPNGVCSRQINFNVVDNKITDVSFIGGCDGNLQGISNLVEGIEVEDAIKKLDGIRCGNNETSCPDQFAKALKEVVLNK
jgi:uncharacterized protein (TIGR03905 family)